MTRRSLHLSLELEGRTAQLSFVLLLTLSQNKLSLLFSRIIYRFKITRSDRGASEVCECSQSSGCSPPSPAAGCPNSAIRPWPPIQYPAKPNLYASHTRGTPAGWPRAAALSLARFFRAEVVPIAWTLSVRLRTRKASLANRRSRRRRRRRSPRRPCSRTGAGSSCTSPCSVSKPPFDRG